MKYINWFNEISSDDIAQVGGKNAALGQMIQALQKKAIPIPNGFAVDADAYWHVLKSNNLIEPITQLLSKIDPDDVSSLRTHAKEIRELIKKADIPKDLQEAIKQAYAQLSSEYGVDNCDVAVRSSATAEDLPTASFAGQQETFLNVSGDDALLNAYRNCVASLFTDRAIIYRIEKKFEHMKVALSVGVQKMIRADKACSGVAFSLDTESGFKDAIVIDTSWGLGEAIVKGIVTPDEYTVYTPLMLEGYKPIIKKKLGDKQKKIVYAGTETEQVPTSEKEQRSFCLSDDEILELARMVAVITEYYTEQHKRWMPMDVEWAKDGIDNKLYILQARPETIHSQVNPNTIITYRLTEKNPTIITSGQSIGHHITSGPARIITDINDINKVKKGDMLITTMTDPDWVPIMKKAGGIITDLGGKTCHAAIVSRELGTPALVGTDNATKVIKDGQIITLDCSQGNKGYVYDGEVPFEKEEIELKKIPKLSTDLLVNIAQPDNAFRVSMLPTQGVGLARIEFIITNTIKVHPMALLEPKNVSNKKITEEIKKLIAPYKDAQDYFVSLLSQGIGMIAAAFYPRPVIVRLSDFKSNEYRNLIGGSFFEQEEANPMLGFRGAFRYYHEDYAPAFALECKAIKKARTVMGLDNIKVMVPFVRTAWEADKVINLMAEHGLKRKEDNLELWMMCEVPSNVMEIEELSNYFDGFSIGSNDLAQLVLGVDRDSGMLTDVFTEQEPAVKKMIALAISESHKAKRPIGICGQAPSNYPEFADFLIEHEIDSISLNPDAVIPFLLSK